MPSLPRGGDLQMDIAIQIIKLITAVVGLVREAVVFGKALWAGHKEER